MSRSLQALVFAAIALGGISLIGFSGSARAQGMHVTPRALGTPIVGCKMINGHLVCFGG